MSVYVGKIPFKFRYMIMFHMSSPALNELHAMAAKIGIARKWFQDIKEHPHYDICKSKKQLALSFGAIEISDIELIKKCYPALAKLLSTEVVQDELINIL